MTKYIVCPNCGMKSFHPMDVYWGYCGNCHDYTKGLVFNSKEDEHRQAARKESQAD